MMKRIVLLFLVWLPLFVEAQNKIINIGTAEEFRSFAQSVNEGNDYEGRNIVLTSNIDLGDEDWTPIGSSSKQFKGTFDGKGHWVSNLNVNAVMSNNAGLFGYIGEGGSVTRLGVASGTVRVKEKTSFNVECYAGGIAAQCEGTISQCANMATIYGNQLEARVGGIAGVILESGIVEDCYNWGRLYTSRIYEDNNYLGGIAGGADDYTIRRVYVDAAIDGGSAPHNAGIVAETLGFEETPAQDAYYSEGDAYYDQDDIRCGESMLGFELDGKLNRRGDYTIWSFAEGRLPLLSQMTELLWGDVNLDGEVSIADVTYLVNIILGKARVNHMADVNRDGDVSIADVTALVNIILGRE